MERKTSKKSHDRSRLLADHPGVGPGDHRLQEQAPSRWLWGRAAKKGRASRLIPLLLFRQRAPHQFHEHVLQRRLPLGQVADLDRARSGRG